MLGRVRLASHPWNHLMIWRSRAVVHCMSAQIYADIFGCVPEPCVRTLQKSIHQLVRGLSRPLGPRQSSRKSRIRIESCGIPAWNSLENQAGNNGKVSNVPCRARHHQHHRYFPCEPGSTPGNTPDGRLAVQKEPLSAGRIPSKSQMFPVTDLNGIRNSPGRTSLPYGMSCSALGSNNRVPEKTPDRQR